jgi:hypothetical protein
MVIACEQSNSTETFFTPKVHDVSEVPRHEYIKIVSHGNRNVPSVLGFARRHGPFANERFREIVGFRQPRKQYWLDGSNKFLQTSAKRSLGKLDFARYSGTSSAKAKLQTLISM